MELANRPRCELYRFVLILHTRQPVLLAQYAIPRRICKVPYGTAHGVEAVMLFAVCFCLYKAFCKKAEVRAYRRSFICIFRFFDVQCILQSLPRSDGRVPSYADCARRSRCKQEKSVLCTYCCAQRICKLFLFHRRMYISYHLLPLPSYRPEIQGNIKDVLCAGV